jgi:hypothetical protein
MFVYRTVIAGRVLSTANAGKTCANKLNFIKRETPAFPPLRPFRGSGRTKSATIENDNTAIGASDADNLLPRRSGSKSSAT